MAESEELSDRVLTVPNLISAARLAAVPVFAVLLLEGHDLWALAVLALSGISDWLDGVLARRLGQTSRLGQVLDPAADRLFILVTLVALGWREVVPWWLLAVVLARDLVLAPVPALLARRGYRPLKVHLVGKTGTFALLYALPLLLLGTWDGPVGAVAGVLGWAFAGWAVGLYWWAAALYLRQAATLLRAPAVAA